MERCGVTDRSCPARGCPVVVAGGLRAGVRLPAARGLSVLPCGVVEWVGGWWGGTLSGSGAVRPGASFLVLLACCRGWWERGWWAGWL